MSISGYAIVPSLSPNLDHFWLQQTLLRFGERGRGLAASLFSQDSPTFLFSSAFLLSLPRQLYYRNILCSPLPRSVSKPSSLCPTKEMATRSLSIPQPQTNQLWPLPRPFSPPFSKLMAPEGLSSGPKPSVQQLCDLGQVT